MNDGMADMALSYFHSMSKAQKRHLMKKIISSLEEDEKVELAKMILSKK